MKEIKNSEIETIKVLGRVALWYLTPINKLITNRSILSSIKKKYFIRIIIPVRSATNIASLVISFTFSFITKLYHMII